MAERRDLDKWYIERLEVFITGQCDVITTTGWFRKRKTTGKVVDTISEAKVLMMLCEERIAKLEDAIAGQYSAFGVSQRIDKERARNLASLMLARVTEDWPEMRGRTLGKQLGITD